MDNGLIFPYRQKTAHSEPVMLTTPTTHRGAFGLCTGCAAWDPNRGVKRINRCDAGR